MAPRAETAFPAEAVLPAESLQLNPSPPPEQPNASAPQKPAMEKEGQPQKQFLLDPVYKSSLVYKPSDYYDNVAPKYNYYEEDLEAQQKQEQKAMLADGPSARRSKRRRTCTLCCCSICYFVFIFLLAAAIVVVKLIPKDPAVSLGDIKITEFVYNDTGSQQRPAGQLQASLSCGLNVTNRNPHALVMYKEINLSLFYRNVSLGSFNIGAPGPQFEQKRKAKTLILADLSTTTTTIGAANAVTLKSEVGFLNVQLDMTGRVKGQMKVLGMKVKKFDVGIDCILNVSPGDGGSKKAQDLSLSCYFDN